MYDLIVKLILITALFQLGLRISDLAFCHSRQCRQTLEQRSRDVLRIDWTPFSVFPEEAKRFR